MTAGSQKPKPISPEILDGLPPQDPDAEKAVLGSILLKQDVLDDVAAIVGSEDFYAEAHGRLFSHFVAMHEADLPIDVVTLKDRLWASGDLEVIGGAAYLGEVAQSSPTAAHAVHYAKIVREKSKLRSVINTGTTMVKEAYVAGTGEADHVLAGAQEALSHAEDRGRGTDAIDAATAVDGAIRQAQQSGEQRRGLPTGLVDFDRYLGGLFPGELVVLAARPRMSKTSLGIQVMGQNSGRGRAVLFASLEMSAVELTTRMLCARAGVDSNRLRTGTIGGGDLAPLEREAGELRGAAFWIVDRPSLTTADIRREARRIQRRSGLALIIADYLQRITPADVRIKRYEQIGQISGDLKRLARELNVPLLLLAQLNREVEWTADHRPRLSHLRESGDIEQDADVVMFLHRPEVYKPDDADLHGKAELIVEKNRNGPTGKFDLGWDETTPTFWTPAPAGLAPPF